MSNTNTVSPQQTPSPVDGLADALEFSADDLTANTEGHLSEMQHWRLRVRRRRSMLIGFAAILGGVFIATILIFMGSGTDGSSILVLIGVGLILLDVAVQAVFVRYWQRLSADIRSGEVTMAQGQLERVIKPVSRRVFNYAVRIGDAEFFVTQQAFEAFAHNQTYIIYRTPHTGILLSARHAEQEN